MTYAPKYMDRIERLNEIATDVKGEVNLTGKGNTELERDVLYKLNMYDEPLDVQVKSLYKIGWAKEMDIIWVKKGTKEDIIGYIEYGKNFTLCIDDNNIITVAKKGENIFSAKKGYKYFSIIPIFQDTKMTIKNSKYEVENLLLTLDRPNATSNEFCGEKDIKLEVNKNVLVIYSKD